MLELIYTSSRTFNIYSGFTPFHLAYMRSWDAMVLFGYQKLDKLFRDGSQANLGVANTYLSMGNRVGGRHFWLSGSDFLAANEITGQYHYSEILNPTWKPAAGACRGGDYLDDVAGLFLHSQTSGKIEVFGLADGVKLGEILDPGGPYYDNLAYAGQGKVMSFHHNTGKLALVDYLNRTVVFKSKVSPCWRSAYDCLHNLVITIQPDRKVRVYALVPVPATLTAPAFVPAAPHQHRLLGSKVQTRLIGDQGEPCGGWWVHWSLKGLPARGYLLKDKSKTDADGYAQNFYFGPAAVGEVGNETIQVRVVV
jgi:hypothetical protein